MPLLDNLYSLQLEAVQTGKYEQIEAIYNTITYKKLTYLERNRGLITAHKLMAFERCQWCYEKEFIDEKPNVKNDKEAFVMGSAFDDFLTEGKVFFEEKYEVVARRDEKTRELFMGKELLSKSNSEMLFNMIKEYRAQPLFSQAPKKKIVLAMYKGLILKIELDDIDDENRLMRDIKTAANIVTFYKEMARFNEKFIGRSKYLFQMSFYFFVLSLTLEKEYGAVLQVVDKNKDISRSGAWVFDVSELRGELHKIMGLLDDLKVSQDSGCFFPSQDQATLYECPYYGLQGHGRPTKYF